jgi:hypothetical protein
LIIIQTDSIAYYDHNTKCDECHFRFDCYTGEFGCLISRVFLKKALPAWVIIDYVDGMSMATRKVAESLDTEIGLNRKHLSAMAA